MFDQEGRQVGKFNPLGWPDPHPGCDSEPDWQQFYSDVLPLLPNAELDTVALTACDPGSPATVSWTSRQNPRDVLAPFAAAGWVPFSAARRAAFRELGVIGYSRSVHGRTIAAAWIPSASNFRAAVEAGEASRVRPGT